jgi:HPt (histidine-containing phosphotransfer) domain-containing protein
VTGETMPHLAVLDARVITALRVFGGEPGELLQEMLLDFLTEAPSLTTQIERAVKDQAYDAAARAAHRLKGTSGHLGARRLAAVAAEVEVSARAGDRHPATRAMARTRAELDLAVAAARLLVV